MKIRRDRTIDKLYVTEKDYLMKVLKKYGMLDAKFAQFLWDHILNCQVLYVLEMKNKGML